MPTIIDQPARIKATGYPPLQIDEFVGRSAAGTEAISIARMTCPAGWSEAGQTPEFAEYTVVLRGSLIVETPDRAHKVGPNQAIIVPANEWVRYSSPEGAEYITVCQPSLLPPGAQRFAARKPMRLSPSAV